MDACLLVEPKKIADWFGRPEWFDRAVVRAQRRGWES